MPVSVPYPNRARPYAGLAVVERGVVDELYRAGLFGLTGLFREALNAGALGGSAIVEDFARALSQLVRSSSNQLANLHHQVGTVMQAAVVVAYDNAVATKGRGDVGSYRLNTRYAGGRLHGALASPEFFRGTHDGIAFGNILALDTAAAQWHRLNFGALPEAGARPRQFAIRWEGLAVAAIGYDEGPSRPFFMPRGFWQGGAFGPTGRAPTTPTKGIQAWNFLDAGVEVLAREIGPAYDALYRNWFASAERGLGPLSRVVSIQGHIAVPR